MVRSVAVKERWVPLGIFRCVGVCFVLIDTRLSPIQASSTMLVPIELRRHKRGGRGCECIDTQPQPPYFTPVYHCCGEDGEPLALILVFGSQSRGKAALAVKETKSSYRASLGSTTGPGCIRTRILVPTCFLSNSVSLGNQSPYPGSHLSSNPLPTLVP